MSEVKRGLNLGCGFVRVQNHDGLEWLNLDSDERVKPDVCRDVCRGLPFANDSFDVVLCSHVLEHFGGADFVFVVNEVYRVLKPNGELHVLSPYFKFSGAWTDPHHKVFMRELSFEPWWWPALSSYSMGVRGVFLPVVVEVVEEKELRVVMRKVPTSLVDKYTEEVGVKRDGGLFPPDFLELVKGKKYEFKA